MIRLVVFLFFSFVFVSCQQKLSQEEMDAYIEDYLNRNGVEFLDKTIDKYLAYKKERGRLAEEPEITEKLDSPLEGASRENMPSRGPEGAVIDIVMFGDFECPYSNRARHTIQALMEKYEGKIRWSYRYNPLDQFAKSLNAAYAAEAAHRQGKFWEMFERIYDNQNDLNESRYEKWAAEIGLNLEQFKKDYASSEVRNQVASDQEFARSNKILSTPVFVINGGVFYGARNQERFERIIDTILKMKESE